jgi:hypothetical protein
LTSVSRPAAPCPIRAFLSLITPQER